MYSVICPRWLLVSLEVEAGLSEDRQRVGLGQEVPWELWSHWRSKQDCLLKKVIKLVSLVVAEAHGGGDGQPEGWWVLWIGITRC